MPHCVLLAFPLATADTGTIAGTVTDTAAGAVITSADIDALRPRRIDQVFRQFVSSGVASSVA